MIEIPVAVHKHFGFAQTAAINNARMIQAIAQDHITCSGNSR